MRRLRLQVAIIGNIGDCWQLAIAGYP